MTDSTYSRTVLLLAMVVGVLASCSPTHAQAVLGPAAGGTETWGDAEDGLQYRIVMEKTAWLHWQQPHFELQVRNASNQQRPAESIRQQLFTPAGVNLLQKPPSVVGERPMDLSINMNHDPSQIQDLGPGEILSLEIRIDSLAQASRSASQDPGLRCDQLEFGIGKLLPRNEVRFLSDVVPLQLLPPGISTAADLDSQLKRIEINDQPVEAAFIPTATRFVVGEKMEVNFLLRNVSNEPFEFIFGGDYRGANRHNRFRIEARDETGRVLNDPGSQFGDMGGITWPRLVAAGRTTVEGVDLAKYCSFPGVGKYTVSCEFDVADDYNERNAETVAVDFILTIEPATPKNVEAVLQRMFARCQKTSGPPLQDTILAISEFGKSDAVPGLAQLTRAPSVSLRKAAIGGLAKIVGPESLAALLAVESDPVVRVDVVRALGAFTDSQAVSTVVAALKDPDVAIVEAAIDSLGRMKTPGAVQALVKTFESAESNAQAVAILSALGQSQKEGAIDVIAGTLSPNNDTELRQAAVAAVVHFGGPRAVAALRQHVEDEDLDFREKVVAALGEKLRQTIDSNWLVPVIRSRNGHNTIGDAPRLMRLYDPGRAVPALIRCLDFDQPSIRSYYNATVIRQQLACRYGLAIPWISDRNRDGTDDERRQNRDILDRLRGWLDDHDAAGWDESYLNPLDPVAQEKSWGEAKQEVKIRARVNASVWPLGLPQVLIVDALRSGGSIHFEEIPKVVEIEVDGQGYVHDADIEPKVCGDWHAYRGNRFQSFQLGPHWKRVSDGKALDLTPGSHTAKIGLVVPPDDGRDKMLFSRSVKFRVVEKSGPR